MEIKITDFKRGGITDELRGESGFGMVYKFSSIRSDRLTPTADFTLSSSPTRDINDMRLSAFDEYSAKLYALGIGDSSQPAVFIYNDSTNQWNYHFMFGAAGIAQHLRVYHDYFYGYRAGSHIWRNTLNGGSMAATYFSISHTTNAPPVHHPADDNLYFFLDNKVYSTDDGATPTLGLTLPNNFVITSGTPSGDYLLIAGYNSKTSESVVYWWDRDSSLTTVTAKNILDLGVANLVARINNVPIAIALAPIGSESELRVYSLTLGGATLVNRFKATSITLGGRHEYDERTYFGINILRGAVALRGIAAVDENGNVTIEYGVNDAVSDVYAVTYFQGAGVARAFVSTSDNNSYNTSGNFGDASILETRFVRAERLTDFVDLVGATVYTKPLPANASVTLKFRTKETDSWTTLKTWDTDGEIAHSVAKMALENPFDAVPEVQFRIELVGSMDLNGVYMLFDQLKKQSYARG